MSSDDPKQPEKLGAFEKWRRTAMLVTGLGVTDDERLDYLVEQTRLACEKKKLQFMQRSASCNFSIGVLTSTTVQVPA
jgi:inner membrane protease ATP23